ncbi:MAG: purine-binding chemotaxis protein CheW [Firmicutes bacterium]|nr:purine-binding chemotaxis protein CheW [Bacillota bacterium]
MTEMAAQEYWVAEEEEDTQKGKYLTFSIGKEIYGIEIKYVTEIIGVQPITEVPELPDYIRGIINLRGQIVPVMDVRLRFKKEFKEYNDRTCVIVIQFENIAMGLIVDSVEEVLSIPDADIVSLPEIKQNTNRYIKSVGKVDEEIKLLLDCSKLLTEEEMESLAEI